MGNRVMTWQAIETAPTDGIHVQVKMGNGVIHNDAVMGEFDAGKTRKWSVPGVSYDGAPGGYKWIGDPVAWMPIADNINHPAHYKAGGIEVIDVIEAYDLGFHDGNAVKYILRVGRKTADATEDIRKAIWYLNRYLEIHA